MRRQELLLQGLDQPHAALGGVAHRQPVFQPAVFLGVQIPPGTGDIVQGERRAEAAAAHLIKTVFISLLLNCFWLSLFYGMNFSAVFIASVPKEAINFPIEVFLIWSIIRVLRRLSLPGERV